MNGHWIGTAGRRPLAALGVAALLLSSTGCTNDALAVFEGTLGAAAALLADTPDITTAPATPSAVSGPLRGHGDLPGAASAKVSPAGSWAELAAPEGVEAPGARWIEVSTPDNRRVLAAVYRPSGQGPYPVAVILPGAEGLRQGHLQVAQGLARRGYIAVAGCWFGTEAAAGVPAGTVPCPNGPTSPDATGEGAIRNALSLIEAARAQPGAFVDMVGLFGHGEGATLALMVASRDSHVRTVVAASGSYAVPALAQAGLPQAQVLMVHGTADERMPVEGARAYEGALRRQGGSVTTHYYESGSHDLPWSSQWQDDVQNRAAAFFLRFLSEY